MLYEYLRVVHDDNGTLTDKSLDNSSESTNITGVLVPGEDEYYLGMDIPFNNFFIQMSSNVNDVSSVMSVYYWINNTWQQAVDVLDGTSANGASLARSGIVTFSPNRQYHWRKTEDTSDTNANSPTELQGLTIYNMHWIKIVFSGTHTLNTAIKRITYAFTRSERLDNLDTQINEYQASFETGKTDWDNEIITASESIIQDLKSRKLIRHRGEILRIDELALACDYKTLAVIYNSLGKSFYDKRDWAEDKYKQVIQSSIFTVDVNNDGFTHENEVLSTAARTIR